MDCIKSGSQMTPTMQLFTSGLQVCEWCLPGAEGCLRGTFQCRDRKEKRVRVFTVPYLCSPPILPPVMKYKSVCMETLIGKGSRFSSKVVKSAIVNTLGVQGKLTRKKKNCLSIQAKLPATGPQGTAFGCAGVAESLS